MVHLYAKFDKDRSVSRIELRYFIDKTVHTTYLYHQTYTKLSIFGHSFKEIIFFVCLIILQSLAPYTYVCVADTHVWLQIFFYRNLSFTEWSWQNGFHGWLSTNRNPRIMSQLQQRRQQPLRRSKAATQQATTCSAWQVNAKVTQHQNIYLFTVLLYYCYPRRLFKNKLIQF